MDTLLTLDIGTTGTKAALISRSGQILATGYADYPTYSEAGNIVEQDPEDWWRATLSAIQQLQEKMNSDLSRDNSLPVLGRVREGLGLSAIILSGQMQDCILLGCDGALGRAILYSDSRAQEEAAWLQQKIGAERLVEITGNEQGASSLLAKLLWLQKHDPERLAKTNAILIGAHDYVAWKLGAMPGADFTTASTTGLLDLQGKTWAYLLLQELGLDPFLLPLLQKSGTLAGELTAEAAALTGLTEGTPILRGCGDLGATTIGVGAGLPGRLYAYLGTSGWVAGSLLAATPNPQGGIFTLCHPDPQNFIQVAPMLTAGGNLEWWRAVGDRWRVEPTSITDYQLLNDMATSVPPGSRGLLYLPYLAGERSPFSDPHARACFIGISQQTTQAEMTRAMMEGVAFAYRSLQEAMRPLPNPRPHPNPPLLGEGTVTKSSGIQELYLVGGGAKSPVWPQILADVLGYAVNVVADPGEAGTRGVAILAGMALGWYNSFAPSSDFFPIERRFEPLLANSRIYDELYPIFRELYPQLKSSFARLAAIHTENHGL
ncbi:MAG: FGGY-family carbohydrate kinase [Caldilineaceae bacterium]